MNQNLPAVSSSDLLTTFEFNEMEKILVATRNDEAREEINNEMQSLDVLIKMMEEHIKELTEAMSLSKPQDKPSRMHSAPSKPRVSSVYVSSQMGNLISLKNLKMSMISKKNDLKNNGLDRAFKVLNQINKDRNGGDDATVPIAVVMEYLLKNGVTMPTNPSDSMRLVIDESEPSEEELDALIDAAIVESGEGFLGEDSNEPAPVVQASPAYLSDSLEAEVVITKPKDASYIYIDLEEGKIYFVNEFHEIVGDELDVDTFEVEEDNEGNFYNIEFDLPVFSSEDVDEEETEEV